MQTLEKTDPLPRRIQPTIYGVEGARPAILMHRCPDAGRPPMPGECCYCPVMNCPGKVGAWGNWRRHWRYKGENEKPEWFEEEATKF